MNASKYTHEPTSELRDNALLLLLANQYLCEELYITKISQSIDENVQKLNKGTVSLKNEYPGKFVSDINTDGIINTIIDKAQLMQKPGKTVQEKCVMGELGRELEEDLRSITDAITRIQRKVEGRDVSYTTKDSMSGLFSGITAIGTLVQKIISLSLKVILVAFLLACFGFGYLYFTMEKISDVRKEMTTVEAIVFSQKSVLSELETKSAELIVRKKVLEKKNLDLKERIEFMDLDVEIHKLNEEKQQVEAELEAQEARFLHYKEKIEAMERKPFLDRLLRQ